MTLYRMGDLLLTDCIFDYEARAEAVGTRTGLLEYFCEIQIVTDL